MKYIITGGGTGGHLYPGIQLAKELSHRGHEVIYVASINGIDQDIFAKEADIPFEVEYWDLRGFSRSMSPKNIIKNLVTGIKVVQTNHKAKQLIKAYQPDFVLGMGGYISYPLVSTAAKMNIACAIHEQNSYPGLVNRKLSKQVEYIFNTYEKALSYFDINEEMTKVVASSNPRIDEARKFKTDDELANSVLFLGGSLGAERINEIAIEYAKANPDKQVDLVCGERYAEELSPVKANNLTLHSYLSDQLKWIDQSEIVITRGGATTLLEVVALEKLALVIPSPNVVANHQYHNAMSFVDKQYLEVIEESDLTLENLTDAINYLLQNRGEYAKNLAEFREVKSLDLILNVLEGELNAKNSW